MSKLLINRNALYPVQSLGPGNRLVIWLQGCSIARNGNPCRGCFSSDFWENEGGLEYDVEALAEEMLEIICKHNLTGITISGGEPTDQSDELYEFMQLLLDGASKDFDTLLFTYFTPDVVKKRFSKLAEIFDAMICGEYNKKLPSELPLIGSSNQEMVFNNKSIVGKYHEYVDYPRLQFYYKNNGNGEIYFTGVPRSGEMDKIQQKLREKGINMDECSWQWEEFKNEGV